jgi:hypothetical protein
MENTLANQSPPNREPKAKYEKGKEKEARKRKKRKQGIIGAPAPKYDKYAYSAPRGEAYNKRCENRSIAEKGTI